MNSTQEPVWARPLLTATHSSSSAVSLPKQAGALPPPKGTAPWRLAWDNKYVILSFIVLGAIGGVIYGTLTMPLYQASATVELVGLSRTPLGPNRPADPQGGGGDTDVATQVRVLKSYTLQNRVLERMNLEMGPATPPQTLFTRLRNRIPYLRKRPQDESVDALDVAKTTLSARGVPATHLIEVSCLSTSPEVAAAYVNTLTSEHQSQTLSARSSATQKTSQWVDSQVEEAKSRLEQANQKLREFVEKSGLDFFPEQATLADTKMRSLQGDVSGIQADRIAKQSRWELAKSTPLDSIPDIMADPSLQGLKAQLTTLRGQRAVLLATLTAEHPKVQLLQAQIDEIEKTFEKEKAVFVKRTQSDYEEALRREKLLTGAYQAQTRSLTAQADKASQYSMLKRDVDTEQQLYNSLLQESAQAALVALAPTSTIRIVDAAFADPRPAKPHPIVEIPVASLAGGLLGFGLIWLQDTMRVRRRALHFEMPGHTLTVLGVPELGVIPSVSIDQPGRGLFAAPFLRGALRITAGDRSGGAGASSRPVPELWHDDRSSFLSESFRQTLVSLHRTRSKGQSCVYVITSAGPGEGKTTLSANLARAMAEVGNRVLLVDSDLRRPNLHNFLGLSDQEGLGDSPGLSDILSRPDELEQLDLDEYIQDGPVGGLSIMTHGTNQTETPALLFFSPRIGDLVALLKARFDCILFDTAPSLPFPDARLWGKHADGIVLVVRAGLTTKQGATAVCERFQHDGVPVLGTILNDWSPKDRSQEAYYGYGYGYGYGVPARNRSRTGTRQEGENLSVVPAASTLKFGSLAREAPVAPVTTPPTTTIRADSTPVVSVAPPVPSAPASAPPAAPVKPDSSPIVSTAPPVPSAPVSAPPAATVKPDSTPVVSVAPPVPSAPVSAPPAAPVKADSTPVVSTAPVPSAPVSAPPAAPVKADSTPQIVSVPPPAQAAAASGPLVSILIPCYNAERWIKQCIESALAQNYPNKEIIVIDDGSTDGSAEVIAGFGKSISFYSDPHTGGNAVRNRLTQLARGEWLQYLDADDYLLPNKISSQTSVVARNDSQIDVVYSPVKIHDPRRPGADRVLEINERDERLTFLRWGPLNTSGLLLRRQAVLDAGGWKEDQACCQEHELLLRLMLAGRRFALRDTANTIYRQHSTETVSRRDPLNVIRTRMELTERMADHLKSSGRLTAVYREALFIARMESARSAWPYDPAFAETVADKAMAAGCKWVHSSAALPIPYQIVFRISGLRDAERLAGWMRNRRRSGDRTSQATA